MFARIALALGLVAACSGPSTHVQPAPATSSAGQGAPACEAVRGKLEQLYRAEAQAQTKDAKRVDQAVADNTAMVLAECNQAPDKVAGCVHGAATAHDVEARCLAPLDDEGTEGERVAR